MTIEERKQAILDKIEEMKVASIPVSELQEAYKEGVNSAYD
jgi:hypothetical protein